MYDGFKQRAQAVYRLLASPGSAFVVVTSPEPPALREARYFLRRLEQDGMPTAGLVVNRVTPPPPEGIGDDDEGKVAEVADQLADGGPEQRAVAALLRLHLDQRELAAREQEAVARALHGVQPPVALRVPRIAGDVCDVDGLRQLARHLVTTPA